MTSLLTPIPFGNGATVLPSNVIASPTIKTPIAGVSPAVSNAVNKTLATGYVPPTSTSSMGSSAGISMGASMNNSMSSAANSLIPSVYDTTTGFLTPYGVSIGAKVAQPGDPNAPKTTTTTTPQPDYSTYGSTPYTAPIQNPPINNGLLFNDPVTGQPISSTNSGGYTYPTIGANPALVPVYQQANNATATANAQYQSDLTAQQRQLQANIAQLQIDKNNAVAAATANYSTNNPEGSGSDLQSYLAEVGGKYDTAISNATADMNTQLTNLSIAHQSALNNIQDQVTSAVTTNTLNTYNSGLNTLATLEKGDGTPLSPFDNATLLSQLVAGGITPQAAQLQIDSALAQAKTAQNKILTTEQRQERSAAITALNGSLSRITDSKVASTDPTIINQVLAAGYVGDPIGYDSRGNPAYTDTQRQQASQYILSQNIKPITTAANIAFKNATLQKDYYQIAETTGFKSAADVINFINNHDMSTASMSDIGAAAQALQPFLGGVPLENIENMIKIQAFKTEPTTTTSNQTGISGLILPAKVTSSVKGNATSSSTFGGAQFSASIGGQTYTFPDQVSLDNFKKQAGIK